MFSFDTQLRVRYADTDQMQVVYHAKLIEYFEVGRTDAIRSLGITYKQIEESGIIMPIVRVECNYLRPARYDELLTIRTMLSELPKDHRIEFDQEIYNEDNKLLCKAKILLYFLDKESNSRKEIPGVLTSKLSSFFE